ncbi:dihydrouridine synthase-domain-containing protein [Dissophora ornata]|nr:dihydrouridine synthase-domain-containing protein [Dissophora ornata]
MLKLQQIKRLSFYKSASLLRMMTTTTSDLPLHQPHHSVAGPLTPQLEPVTPPITDAAVSALTAAMAGLSGLQTASGRPVEPRRIPLPIAVAPMVDVTTSHFLQLCKIISPNFTVYTEMIHCNALIYNPKDLYNFFGEPWEGKVVQLGGSDPEAMAKAAMLVQENGYKELNLNVGCPSPRVQKGAFGAVLMKTPSTVVQIIQEMGKAGVTIPVTVKCRIGVDNLDSYDYLYEFIKLISTTTPVNHFIVHARKCWLKGLSPKQNRSVPPLKYEVVYQLAKDFPHLTITINGGFNTTTQLKEQLDLVDGVMVGREVMDRPMFLAKVDAAYHKVPPENIKTTEEIVEEFLQYVLTEHERGTPHSNSVVMAPLKMLYGGRRGKEYRRRLAAVIMPRTKPLPDIVRDMRQMMQEMDFSASSESDDGGELEAADARVQSACA